jgi:hypothetical protein
MLQGLAEGGVRFVVVGGVAATAHGSTHVTNDLDICYDTADANVRSLAGLLAAWHAYPRGVEPGLTFIMDARTLRASPILTLTTDHGDLDVLDRVEGVGSYADVRAASEPIDLPPIRFLALGLPALVAAKRATRRPKDLAQLPELEALLRLRRRKARDWGLGTGDS